MIQLHNDYLLITTPGGAAIPCSAELVAIELVGQSDSPINDELIRHAAKAVLHYFKHDLGRETVSVADFSCALHRVLSALGVTIKSEEKEAAPAPAMPACDLRELACGHGEAFELAFFQRLRELLRSRLNPCPRLLRFQGLRPCVKQLLGAKRWNGRCQQLNDQIVTYLRDCLQTESPDRPCGLVVM